jgi:hypothetical protein
MKYNTIVLYLLLYMSYFVFSENLNIYIQLYYYILTFAYMSCNNNNNFNDDELKINFMLLINIIYFIWFEIISFNKNITFDNVIEYDDRYLESCHVIIFFLIYCIWIFGYVISRVTLIFILIYSSIKILVEWI